MSASSVGRREPGRGKGRRTKSRVLVSAKLVVGLSLLGFLVARADFEALYENLSSLDPVLVAVVLVLPHVAIWLSTLKWQILLRELGVNVPMGRLLALYMIGTFFNNFLPTMVGGDVVKAYQLGREVRDPASVIAATFMERFVGLAALVSLLPLVLLQDEVTEAVPLLPLFVFAIIVLYVVALIIVFSRAGRWIPGERSRYASVRRMSSVLAGARSQVRNFRERPRGLVAAYLISLAFYLLTATTSWVAARSASADVDLGYLISTVPVILLVALIPVSLNGLGVTETGYVLFLHLKDVATVDAVAMALLLRFRVIVSALIGGLLLLRYRTNPTETPRTLEGTDAPETVVPPPDPPRRR